jgi:thiamine biosynthesis lipoprotein
MLAVALAAVDAPTSAPSPAAPVHEMRLVMGTTAELWVDGLERPAPALDAAFAVLDAVDASMSLWKQSELAALNRSGDATVSPLLFETLRRALDVAADSGGAFDPTVEPLMRAYGAYGESARRPSEGETRRLLARVGFGRVRLDAATRRVRLEPGTALDLGGIAKGYAADLALRELRRAGALRTLVDLGTSSQCVFGDALTLDVAHPLDPAQPAWARFTLRDACVASSGASQRGEHILDPRNGRPPASGVLGATVVASEGAEADALSTALYVLGPEEGLRLLARRGAHGFVLMRRRGRSLMLTTPDFAERHALEAEVWVRLREGGDGVPP